MRIPSRVFGIRDFPYLKLGIRDLKAKSGRDSGFQILPSGLRDCTRFLVGITGLKNPIGDFLRNDISGTITDDVLQPRSFMSKMVYERV